MPTTAGPAAGEQPLLTALDRATDAVAAAAGEVSWQTPEPVVLDAVRRVAELRSQVDALYLDLVRQVDERGVATASPVATTPEGFLRTTCLIGAAQARRDVAAARATAPGRTLEPFAAALAEGRTTKAHVDVAVRVLDRIPEHVLARPGAPQKVVDYLSLAADQAGPLDMDRAARRLLVSLAPDREDRFDPESHQRRFLDHHTDATGMVVGTFQLDPVGGATFTAALRELAAPLAGADGEPDRRQPRQRRADALVAMADVALSVSAPRRGERPRVVVHVTPDQLRGASFGLGTLEGGGPVETSTARALACDAVLQRVVVDPSAGPLDVGRAHRLVTLPQRRALEARDGGCIIPGCGAPPAICDAHHVEHWVDGGPTDLCNLCLLCPAHHTAVHAGTWAVEMVDGQLLVTPPRWVDPTRRPRPVRHHVLTRTVLGLTADDLTADDLTADDLTAGDPTPGVVAGGGLDADERSRREPAEDVLRKVLAGGRDGPRIDVTISPFIELLHPSLEGYAHSPP
jgi:hypothetical protein